MADIEYIEDEFGETLRMRKLPNNRYIGETFTWEKLQGIKTVSLREDDILTCAYPKSGGHWLWENIRMLVSGKVIHDTVDKDSTMMEFFEPGELDNQPSPRFLNNHSFFDGQPEDLLKGKGKVILLYRNPKDVAVSFYYHISRWHDHEYSGSFGHFVRRLVKGIIPFNSPFDYWKQWEKGLQDNPQIKFLPVRYEDLHKNHRAELERICTFLGLDRTSELLESIVKATSFDKIVEVKSQDCLLGKDGHPLMYRKGKVGDWKNHFTVKDNEWFDGVIQNELGDSKIFEFIYSI